MKKCLVTLVRWLPLCLWRISLSMEVTFHSHPCIHLHTIMKRQMACTQSHFWSMLGTSYIYSSYLLECRNTEIFKISLCFKNVEITNKSAKNSIIKLLVWLEHSLNFFIFLAWASICTHSVRLLLRSYPYPEGQGYDGAEPLSGLGSGRIHGLRFSSKGRHSCASQWSGCGERDLQVRTAASHAPEWTWFGSNSIVYLFILIQSSAPCATRSERRQTDLHSHELHRPEPGSIYRV